MVSEPAAMASDQSIVDHDPPARAQDPPISPLLPLAMQLDRTNYSYWRALVLAAVRAYDLEGFLDGSTPPPPRSTPGNPLNPVFNTWICFDQFLLHWLLNSITETMIEHVVNCRSANEIWTTLGTLFHTISKARILQIKGLLQSTKKGNLSIHEYLLKMKRFADTLLEAGDPVSDENLCLYILGGLGSEYESVMVALTNRSEQLTLQDLQFNLQTHEMRIQSLASSTIDSVQANLANLNIQNNNRGQLRGSCPYNRGGRSRFNGCSDGRGNA